MLAVLDPDPNLLSGRKSHLKAMSSPDKLDRDWSLLGKLLFHRDVDGHRMLIVNGERNRKALNHGERKGILIHVVTVDHHMVLIDVDINLLVSEPDDRIETREEWEGQRAQR